MLNIQQNIIQNILNMFNYQFILNSLIAGIFITIACSLLGVFIVLRKNSFISEGLAHISFMGLALGLFFNFNPFIISLIITILAGIYIIYLQEKTNLIDSIIGIVSYTGFALGIIFVSLSKGFSTDLFSFLFGNILTINKTDVLISFIINLLVLGVILLLNKKIIFIIFDKDTAKSTGINVKLMNYILIILIALTVSISIRLIGIILVASFMIIPASASLNIAKSFKQSLIYSVLIGIISLILGIIFSFLLDIPTGATIVIISFLIFLITSLKK